MTLLKLRAAQLNPVVGDIKGNLALARAVLDEARAAGDHLAVVSEHFILGYPAEDLVLKRGGGGAVDVGGPRAGARHRERPRDPDRRALAGGGPRSPIRRFCLKAARSARAMTSGSCRTTACLTRSAIIRRGDGPVVVVDFKGVRIGLAICEDIWFERVPRAAKAAGADVLLVPNASPWRRAIQAERASGVRPLVGPEPALSVPQPDGRAGRACV